MRPKKLILLIDDRPQRLRVTRFVLEVRGGGWQRSYRVRMGTGWPRTPHWDLANAEAAVVCLSDPAAASRVCRELHRCLPGIRVLQIGAAAKADPAAVEAWLPADASMARILETLRILSQRKRGPKGCRHAPKKPAEPALPRFVPWSSVAAEEARA
jgi:hypothetical protein